MSKAPEKPVTMIEVIGQINKETVERLRKAGFKFRIPKKHGRYIMTVHFPEGFTAQGNDDIPNGSYTATDIVLWTNGPILCTFTMSEGVINGVITYRTTVEFRDDFTPEFHAEDGTIWFTTEWSSHQGDNDEATIAAAHRLWRALGLKNLPTPPILSS